MQTKTVGVALTVAVCLWTSTPRSVRAQSCAGDCDGNGTVTIDELITAVNIALEVLPLERCGAADHDGSAAITVDELVLAVSLALSNCPMVTPAVTPTATETPPPTATPTSGVPTPPLVGEILFQSTRNGSPHIFVMAPDGTNVRELTQGSASDRAPRWNADRSRIVFTRDGRLHVMNGDGSGITQLLSRNTQFAPTFSSDGSAVVYVDLSDRSNIFRYTLDTGDIRPLTAGAWSDASPTFTPDGQHIFFTSNRDSIFFEIYRMDPDGSNVVRVTNNQNYDALGGVSPNETRLVSAGRAAVGTVSFGIFTSDLDGSNVVQLTSTSDDSDDESPLWSPDGNYIAYRPFINGRPKIYRMQSDGQFPTDLSRNDAYEFASDWK